MSWPPKSYLFRTTSTGRIETRWGLGYRYVGPFAALLLLIAIIGAVWLTRRHTAGKNEIVTKLVEPSIPQRLLTRSRFVVTDLSYARQSRGSS